jgi:hypothetical protein
MKILTQPLEAFRARVKQALERVPVWKTPAAWADAGGLYATLTQGWVYREFPLTLLRPDADGRVPLDDLTQQLAAQRPDREIHIVLHAWEHQAQVPHGTPAGLADYLEPAMSFFVPTRRLLIGVRLDPAPDTRSRLQVWKQDLNHALDTLLGEAVPPFADWAADRAAVTEILEAAGGFAPTTEAAAHLDGWYTLGAPVDVRADERDEVIALGVSDVIEMVAAAALTPGEHTPLPLMPGGQRGSTVASVRGVLQPDESQPSPSAPRPTGFLNRASVVLGRRSQDARAPWPVTLRALPGLEQRPLPLRQLRGLEETLPCAPGRVSPVLHRLRAAHLAQAGVTDTGSPGDDTGLFLGLASPAFANPCFVDLLTPAASTVLVTGEPGAGKTFLAESLAVQSHHAGSPVTYAAFTTGGGQGFAELTGAPVVTVAAPGCLDPFRTLPAQTAAALVAATLPALVPDLTAAELAGLQAGFRRAAAAGVTSFDQVLALASHKAAVARVRRAGKRDPLVALITGTPAPGQSPDLPIGAVLDFTAALAGAGETGLSRAQGALVDLACATLLHRAAALRSDLPAVVVLDGAGSALVGSATPAALTGPPGSVHTVVITSLTSAAAPAAPHCTTVVCLAESDPAQARAAFSMTGVPLPENGTDWLAAAGATVEDGTVQQAATGLLRDRAGRSTTVLIGPVPKPSLPALTRGRATEYPGDS